MMFWAQYVVSPQVVVVLVVEAAVIAGPMRTRTILMLFEGISAREPTIAPVTVRHDYVEEA